MKPETELAQNRHRKSEKISALAALLGTEAMDRLRKRHPDFRAAEEPAAASDSGRVAWQRNRLLEKLRADLGPPPPPDINPSSKGAGRPGQGNAERMPSGGDLIDAHIASGLSLANLRHEHPAVIARVLRGLDRAARVSLLQQLPGHAARAALRRLKSLPESTRPK